MNYALFEKGKIHVFIDLGLYQVLSIELWFLIVKGKKGGDMTLMENL